MKRRISCTAVTVDNCRQSHANFGSALNLTCLPQGANTRRNPCSSFEASCWPVHLKKAFLAWWLLHWNPDWAVWVQAWADSLYCSCKRHLKSLSRKPLSTQVYKWGLVSLMLRVFEPCNDLASHPRTKGGLGRVENLLSLRYTRM